jgi:hypothetical protein
MTYDPAVTTRALPLPHRVLLDCGRQYTVNDGSELFRHATGDDGCKCDTSRAGGDRCPACSTACLVAIILSSDETIDV